jgi:hypothetical protein
VEGAVEPARTAGGLSFLELAALLTAGLAVGFMCLVYFNGRIVSAFRTRAALPPGYVLSALIATGLGLHNFSEGLAIGQSAATGALVMAGVLVIGFALHNITEGFGIAAPLVSEPAQPSWAFLGLPAHRPSGGRACPTARPPVPPRHRREALRSRLQTGVGRDFDADAVASLRQSHHIPSATLLKEGELTVSEVASRLGIRPGAVIHWINGNHQNQDQGDLVPAIPAEGVRSNVGDRGESDRAWVGELLP